MDLTTRSPEVVTYRLGDKMAYVTPAVNYEVSLGAVYNAHRVPNEPFIFSKH